jgi:putative Holliday junction resolvase
VPSANARTLLAFDWGLTQIGVAVGSTAIGSCQPLPVLPAREGSPDWEAVARLLQTWQPDLLLVGEPLNMDGSPGELHARACKFAKRLHGRFGLPCEMVDERLSSAEAKSRLRDTGHAGDYKARPADSLAAALILETWLASAGDNDR